MDVTVGDPVLRRCTVRENHDGEKYCSLVIGDQSFSEVALFISDAAEIDRIIDALNKAKKEILS